MSEQERIAKLEKWIIRMHADNLRLAEELRKIGSMLIATCEDTILYTPFAKSALTNRREVAEKHPEDAK